MTGEIDGDTDAMREFSKQLLGSLETAPATEFGGHRTSVPCPNGVGAHCDDLTHADNAATDALHTFITQVAQGLELYSAFVRQSAATYTQADELARDELLATLDSRPDPNPR